MDIFEISQCNIAQIIGEASRFMFHVTLVHISSCIIDGKDTLFGEQLFKTLMITFMAIVLYHIFFRKIIEPPIKKMKTICDDNYIKEYIYTNNINDKKEKRKKRRKEKSL